LPPWVQIPPNPYQLQHLDVGLEAQEALELAAAFRGFGFWRIDLDSGLTFGTSEFSRIMGLQHREGAIDMIALGTRIHSDDLPLMMMTFERASVARATYHNIFRVKAPDGHYKYVRSVGKFREKQATSGEVVGITYEFFERQSGASFFATDPAEISAEHPVQSEGPDTSQLA
jgi:PAS domain-containing protein